MELLDYDTSRIDQRKYLLETILSHKREFVENFLSERNLPYSYKKEILYTKLAEGLDDDKLSMDELIDLLDKIEEFGNQHIYLYSCNPEYIKLLRNPDYVLSRLKDNKIDHLYNNKYGIIIPMASELSTIVHNERILKFKWIEKRIWKYPLEEKIEDDKFLEIHQINVSRGVTTFRVDLVSGATELMIQRLSRGTNYGKIKDEYLTKLNNIIQIYSFSPVNIRRATKQIERSNEAEKRQMNLETISGGRISFKSKDKDTDYAEDPHLSDARHALGDDVSCNLGNFYWKPNHILERAIHTHIYSDDNRVAIFGQCLDKEVNYVLSRVRHFASS